MYVCIKEKSDNIFLLKKGYFCGREANKGEKNERGEKEGKVVIVCGSGFSNVLRNIRKRKGNVMAGRKKERKSV